MSRTGQRLLKALNPRQVQAVEHKDGPLLILAGAGTGKTRVITHRIAYLIAGLGIRPWNILALTFTNKAAEEMKERAVQLVGEEGRGVTLSTFHSFCNYILRREIDRLPPFRSGFSIYDETDADSCIRNILKQLDISSISGCSPARIRNLISRAKNFDTHPGEYVSPTEFLVDHIETITERYRLNLEHNNALDFDDLLLKTVELFRNNPDVLQKYRNRFRYILVDEYQDTNQPQYELLLQLAAPTGNVTVVGDLDQSIYGWRGANVGNMYSFEKDFNDVTVVTLEQNYRSKQSILDTANSLIRNNRGIREKFLWSELGAGEKAFLMTPWDERQEASDIALEIDHLVAEGFRLNDIAVMFRTKAQSRVLEETFMRMSVPHVLVGATAFYDRKEIKDVLAFLRVIENPRDFTAFQRIANVPKRGIGKKTLEKVEELARQSGSVLDLVDDEGKPKGELPKKAAPIIKVLRSLRANRMDLGLGDFIARVIEETEYGEHLQQMAQKEGTASRRENVEELASMAAEYAQETNKPTLEGFLARIALISDTDVKDFGEGSVVLITLHSAKGLEFPVVFIAGVEENLLPHSTSLEEGNVEEERRLCYVGITRAKEMLYLSCCRSRLRFGRVMHNDPSRFLQEIGPDHFQSMEGPHGGAGKESFFDEDSAPEQAGRAAPGIFGGTSRRRNHEEESFFDDFSAKRKYTSSRVHDEDFDDIDSGGAQYRPGQKVLHEIYGEGKVISIENGDITISFPGLGTKCFMLEFAPIRKY